MLIKPAKVSDQRVQCSKKANGQDAPWLIRTAAYTPIVVFASGTKLVLMVAAVEMKVAHPKLCEYVCQHRMTPWMLLERKNLIPVVTAT